MKRKYITPNIIAIELTEEESLLAGSPGVDTDPNKPTDYWEMGVKKHNQLDDSNDYDD